MPKCEIALWKGFENELFQYASQTTLEPFSQSINNYVEALYNNNYNVRVVDDQQIINNQLNGIKLLIMPECYCASRQLFEAVDEFVKNGGILLCEAHFGGYDIDNGRHSYIIPGDGAAERWGIREIETTSSYHLKLNDALQKVDLVGVSEDVKKAFDVYGASGGKYYPAFFEDGSTITMCERVAFLKGGKTLAAFDDKPIIVVQAYEKGMIIYCGSNPGEGASKDFASFDKFLCGLIEKYNIHPNLDIKVKNVHIDVISDKIVSVKNMTKEPFALDRKCKSVFYEDDSSIVAPNCADIFILDE